jgi:hypothetical protein
MKECNDIVRKLADINDSIMMEIDKLTNWFKANQIKIDDRDKKVSNIDNNEKYLHYLNNRFVNEISQKVTKYISNTNQFPVIETNVYKITAKACSVLFELKDDNSKTEKYYDDWDFDVLDKIYRKICNLPFPIGAIRSKTHELLAKKKMPDFELELDHEIKNFEQFFQFNNIAYNDFDDDPSEPAIFDIKNTDTNYRVRYLDYLYNYLRALTKFKIGNKLKNVSKLSFTKDNITYFIEDDKFLVLDDGICKNLVSLESLGYNYLNIIYTSI